MTGFQDMPLELMLKISSYFNFKDFCNFSEAMKTTELFHFHNIKVNSYDPEDEFVVFTNVEDFITFYLNNNEDFQSKLKAIALPPGLEKIPENCFCRCFFLEEVIFPSTLKCIQNNAFKYCESLKNLDIPEGVVSLGEYCFEGCSGLVKIPSTITTIPQGCFASFQGTVVLPKTIKNICPEAFTEAVLEDFSLPEELDFISYGCFNQCQFLCDIKIPNITDCHGAFSGAYFKKVTIASTVKHIQQNCFEDSSIEELIFEEGLEIICNEAFKCCHVLNFKFPKSLMVICSDAFIYSDVNEILFDKDSKLEMINDRAFMNNTNLDVFEFHKCDRLKRVGSRAFLSTELRYIEFGEGLEVIESEAFKNNFSLDGVICPESLKYVGYQAFAACRDLELISLPKNAFLYDECIGKDVEIVYN
jgi:hypothetical protein